MSQLSGPQVKMAAKRFRLRLFLSVCPDEGSPKLRLRGSETLSLRDRDQNRNRDRDSNSSERDSVSGVAHLHQCLAMLFPWILGSVNLCSCCWNIFISLRDFHFSLVNIWQLAVGRDGVDWG